MARYFCKKRLCLVTKIGMMNFMNLVHGSEYVTSNPREIRAIEETGFFKNGVIVKEQEAPVVKAAPTPAKPNYVVVPEVTNCVQAKDWLSKNKGVQWKGLVSRAKIFEVASENHVEFPNLPASNVKK